MIFYFPFNIENWKHDMEAYKMVLDMVMYARNISCWKM